MGGSGDIHVAGTGSFALEAAEYARDAGIGVAGLIELMDPSRVGTEIHGLPVRAAHDPPENGASAIVGAGGDRLALWALLAPHGWHPATVVYPTAHVSASAGLGEGCVVAPGAVIGAATSLGDHVLVGRGALVGHHAALAAGVVLNPGANVAGHAGWGGERRSAWGQWWPTTWRSVQTPWWPLGLRLRSVARARSRAARGASRRR
jgi:hypothetical protein